MLPLLLLNLVSGLVSLAELRVLSNLKELFVSIFGGILGLSYALSVSLANHRFFLCSSPFSLYLLSPEGHQGLLALLIKEQQIDMVEVAVLRWSEGQFVLCDELLTLRQHPLSIPLS